MTGWKKNCPKTLKTAGRRNSMIPRTTTIAMNLKMAIMMARIKDKRSNEAAKRSRRTKLSEGTMLLNCCLPTKMSKADLQLSWSCRALPKAASRL